MVANLFLLGPPRLEIDHKLVTIALRKAMALLVYLADTRQVHSRDALATLFWPEQSQRTARTNLRRTLHDLVKLLREADAEALLMVEAESVAVNRDAGLQVDIACFEGTLGRWLPTGTTEQTLTPEGLAALEQAADLYQDEFLAGFSLPDAPAFDDWQFFRREGLRQSYTRLLQQLIHTYHAAGDQARAIHSARRLLHLDGLEESAHRRLMQLYATAGQQAAALRQYEECRRILREELDVEPAAETTDLYEAIRTRRLAVSASAVGAKESATEPATPETRERASQRPPQPATTPAQATGTAASALHPFPHNLSAQPTPFVGRIQDQQNLLQHLQEPTCRLLSLIGPGGIGKTRLALAVAQALVTHWEDETTAATTPGTLQQAENPALDQRLVAACAAQFRDGIFFVQLQPLCEPGAIVTAIGDALGIQFYGSDPIEQQLMGYLADKALLLLLDNFEHLLDGAALLSDLLSVAPQLKLFVTSREALKLHEEWFHPIAGLRFPTLDDVPAGIDRVTYIDREARHAITQPHYDALTFFIQSAQRVAVTFQSAEHATAIVQICRLVDGMPLALELAAAWLKVLSCQAIAEEIERGIDLLVSRHQNVPERHRNIRVVLDQSWQLLNPNEQGIMRQLSIFRGGFTTGAARAVAGASLLDLAGLLDKSFLRREGERYQIHELTRQYAAERLADNEQDADLAVRHSRYYLTLLAERDAALRGADPADTIAKLRPDLENIEAAWHQAVAQAEVGLLQQALTPLAYLNEVIGFLNRGKMLFRSAADTLDGAEMDTDRATLVSYLYAHEFFFAAALGLLPQMETRVTRATEVAAETGNRLCCALVEFALGTDELYRQQNEKAAARLAALLPDFERAGAWYQRVRCLHHLGEAYGRLHQYREAHAHLQQALRIAQQQQSKREQALTYSHLGVVYFYQNDLPQACTYSQRAVDLFAAIGDLWRAGVTANNVGFILHRLGENQEALSWTLRAQTWLQRTTRSLDLGTTYDTLGCIHFALGNYAEARTAHTFALGHAEEHQRPVEAFDALLNLVLIDLAEEAFDMAESHLQTAKAHTEANTPLPPACMAKFFGITGLYHRAHRHPDQAKAAYHHALKMLDGSEETYLREQILAWQQAE